MINWHRTRTSPATGAIRHYSKRRSVLKRKTTEPAHSRRFTKLWKIPQLRGAHTNNVNSFGTTRPDLMPRGCWGMIREGSTRLRFKRACHGREAIEVMTI